MPPGAAAAEGEAGLHEAVGRLLGASPPAEAGAGGIGGGEAAGGLVGEDEALGGAGAAGDAAAAALPALDGDRLRDRAALVRAVVSSWARWADPAGAWRGRVDAHAFEYPGPLDANVARNVAVDHAPSDYVLLLEGGAVPGPGAFEGLAPLRGRLCGSPTALLVPAFSSPGGGAPGAACGDPGALPGALASGAAVAPPLVRALARGAGVPLPEWPALLGAVPVPEGAAGAGLGGMLLAFHRDALFPRFDAALGSGDLGRAGHLEELRVLGFEFLAAPGAWACGGGADEGAGPGEGAGAAGAGALAEWVEGVRARHGRWSLLRGSARANRERAYASGPMARVCGHLWV